MEKEADILEPYSNITDFKIFEYILNNSYSIEEYKEKFNLLSKNIDALYFLANETIEYGIRSGLKEFFYKDIINDYKTVLKKTSRLAKELKLKNSLELSTLFTYLMWNGYFSKNKKHEYKQSLDEYITGFYGLQLINGTGVCINHSFMLKDFLVANKINSIVIEANSDGKDTNKFSNYVDLKNIVDKSNHAFNLIEENKNLYIYDATSICIFDIQNPYIVKKSGEERFFTINPYSFLSSDCGEYSNLTKELFTRSEFNSPYSNDKYEKLELKCISKIKDNKKLLKDYYDDTKGYILKISKGIKK